MMLTVDVDEDGLLRVRARGELQIPASLFPGATLPLSPLFSPASGAPSREDDLEPEPVQKKADPKAKGRPSWKKGDLGERALLIIELLNGIGPEEDRGVDEVAQALDITYKRAHATLTALTKRGRVRRSARGRYRRMQGADDPEPG